jgi:hypothetical protein
MGKDVLQPDELEIIDEGIGLNRISEMVDDERARSLLGLGEDLQRAADTGMIGPTAAEIEDRISPPKRKLPAMKVKPKPKGVPAPGGMRPSNIQTVRSIPVIPNEIVVTNFQINSDKPYRVDLGIDSRTDILIANMSLSVIWVNAINNVSPSAGQFIGVPLKAMTAANTFDGGVMRVRITNNKRFWAIAVAAGARLVVTIETALRE